MVVYHFQIWRTQGGSDPKHMLPLGVQNNISVAWRGVDFASPQLNSFGAPGRESNTDGIGNVGVPAPAPPVARAWYAPQPEFYGMAHA